MTTREITFTKQLGDGRTVERVATTPSEIVQAQFDGWVEKKTPNSSTTGGDAKHVTGK